MLGVWGAESRTGKPAAADIRRRKKSLPVVYALARAEGATAAELRRIYAQPQLSDADVSIVLRPLDAVGAQAYCRAVAEEHGERRCASWSARPSRPERCRGAAADRRLSRWSATTDP